MSAQNAVKKELYHRERRLGKIAEGISIPLIALLLLGAVMPGESLAASPHAGSIRGTTNCNGNSTCDLDSTLNNIQYFLIGVGVLIGGIMFALFGIQHMAGAVEEMPPEKRLQRRHQFMTLIVGLVIVSTSVVLVHVAQGLIVTS
ncbi:MAG: hypothetical protein M1144_00285 [Candidatus Thermoplasmatota archaeon]|nr:hypothetical protein [Candidatus Thermoplasmatota archaeon]